MKKVFLLLVVLLVVSQCHSSGNLRNDKKNGHGVGSSGPDNKHSKAVFFEGIYTTNIPNITNLRIQFSTGNNVKIIGGCNDHSAKYTAYKNGSITFGVFASTKRYCLLDWDYLYLDALKNAIKYVQDQDQITLKNKYNKVTIVLTLLNLNIVELPVGKYQTSIPDDSDLLIQFLENSKVSILNGCNSHSGSYQAYLNGSITFGAFASTKKYCTIDNDSKYLNALKDSVSFTKKNGVITFKNAKNVVTIVLTPYVSVPAPARITFKGTYSTSINDDCDLLVKFDYKNVYILNGCNSHTASYKAYDDGSIEFGEFVSTQKFCQNDKDSLYLQALSKSVTFVTNSDKQIILKNNKNKTTIVLTPYKVTSPPVAIKYYYDLVAAYQMFQGYVVVNEKDEHLAAIIQFLLKDYSHFLVDYQITAAFKRFRDGSIDYQILLKTSIGTFNAIVEYTADDQVLIKSLAIIDYNTFLISYQNCEVRDQANRNCKTCASGYRNFQGRCYLIDSNCSRYVADQCVDCKKGKLLNGECPKY